MQKEQRGSFCYEILYLDESSNLKWSLLYLLNITVLII
jgi:hypothetical protein